MGWPGCTLSALGRPRVSAYSSHPGLTAGLDDLVADVDWTGINTRQHIADFFVTKSRIAKDNGRKIVGLMRLWECLRRKS